MLAEAMGRTWRTHTGASTFCTFSEFGKMSNQDGKCLPPGRTCLSPACVHMLTLVRCNPFPHSRPLKAAVHVSLAHKHGMAAAATIALDRPSLQTAVNR